jgi:hypothetical protein
MDITSRSRKADRSLRRRRTADSQHDTASLPCGPSSACSRRLWAVHSHSSIHTKSVHLFPPDPTATRQRIYAYLSPHSAAYTSFAFRSPPLSVRPTKTCADSSRARKLSNVARSLGTVRRPGSMTSFRSFSMIWRARTDRYLQLVCILALCKHCAMALPGIPHPA